MSRLRAGIITTLAGSSLVISSAAMAAPSASIVVAPAKITIGRQATVIGKHLKPRAIYTLMLTMPNFQHAKVKQLFGIGKSNAKGALRVTVAHMPIVTRCGAATIYAFTTTDPKLVSYKVKVIGCSIKAHGPIQPPPPPGKKP